MTLPLIDIQNVSVAYGSPRVPVLNGINLHIDEGDFICVLGQTGCGKSTLLRLVLGSERPAGGRILVVPTLAESLPYVVLEAAAACQPLDATRVGGIPEIFGATAGDLVPSRDAGALAGAIRQVLDESPDVLAARVRALSESIRKRFSLERMGADVVSGYAAAFQARAERSSVGARKLANHAQPKGASTQT